ncbi:MAG: ammonium transporter [Nevskia sp.]|nr:ammonium transporter [Nevskia sp.]MBX6421815.1 ammonium transporter [Nevskia sp.]
MNPLIQLVRVALFATALAAGGAALADDQPAPAEAPGATTEAAPAASSTAAPVAPAEAAPAAAPAAPATVKPELNTGDTAWMLTSMALVLMMTIPGLALFYGGMVRTKNVLATIMQCFAITCLITVLWTIYGYSVAFDNSGMTAGVVNHYSFVGSLYKAFMHHVDVAALWQPNASVPNAIPETVFSMFQLTFAIITPALIVGSFAERLKFSTLLIYITIWWTLSYLPIAHMVWGGPGSFLGDRGQLDFAGGTVVHINAGIAGLVGALVLGKRKGYGTVAMPPHNLAYTVTGASLLWVGWFGFNAGSAVAANGAAGMAMAVTQIATATAALAWMFAEWLMSGKPTTLGIASGAVAGLVAITPASGFVGPVGALWIGVAAGVIPYLAATKLKHALGYDDSLDAFGVHAVGGIVGALLTGVFCAPSLGGTGFSANATSIGHQVWIQCGGVAITLIVSALASFIAMTVAGLLTGGARVTEEQETEGLDLALHNEKGLNL